MKKNLIQVVAIIATASAIGFFINYFRPDSLNIKKNYCAKTCSGQIDNNLLRWRELQFKFSRVKVLVNGSSVWKKVDMPLKSVDTKGQ